jgi:small subunit ribosomal protein S25
MKGRGALRRTLKYLEKGQLVLRDNVKILTFQYNVPAEEKHIVTTSIHNRMQESHGKKPPETAHHDGLRTFVFWHLPQLQYKNEHVQMVTFNELTPTPWIRAHLEDDSTVLIDCDGRSRQEIHDHVKAVLGKSDELLAKEKKSSEIMSNPSNFGFAYDRFCICEVPGQVPCPGYTPLPKEMTGKWQCQQRQLELEKNS